MRHSTLAAVMAVATVSTACGPPCKTIADARDALRSNRGAITQPHARVVLPHTLANRLLADAVKQTPPLPVKAPILAPMFEPLLGTLDLVIKEVRLVPAQNEQQQRLGLDLKLELRAERATLATLSLRTQLLPRVRRDEDGARYLELGLDADSIKSLKPKISPGAADRIATLLEARLPAAIRALTPRAAITAAATKTVAWLGEEGFALLREPLLHRLGRISGLRVKLPDLPIERVQLRSMGSALELDLFTALPVRTALPQKPSPLPSSPGALQVRVAGSAVAELTNWAIDRGLLPRHYDKQLRPKPKGGFRPHFDWRAGQPRPLKVHVFRTRPPCAHVLVGARAEVHVADDKLKITITDRKVERVEGPPLVKLGVWLDELWSTAVSKTRERAAAMVVKRGKHRVELRVKAAVLTDEELAFSLGVRL